jgi:hypothetical protein
MRWSLLAVLACALAFAGCRSDEELAAPDLSSTALYCPPDPPTSNDFVCDPTAIPSCTYPAQDVTCVCTLVDRGRHVLLCPTDDLGVSDGAEAAD